MRGTDSAALVHWLDMGNNSGVAAGGEQGQVGGGGKLTGSAGVSNINSAATGAWLERGVAFVVAAGEE